MICQYSNSENFLERKAGPILFPWQLRVCEGNSQGTCLNCELSFRSLNTKWNGCNAVENDRLDQKAVAVALMRWD